MAFRCGHCDDVIGVYEPMIVLRDGQPHTTSRATAQEGSWGRHGQCYHAACYEHVAAKGTAP
jgi:hypothetical protein